MALGREARDEGVVRSQQVEPVARREAVEVDPGRGAQAQHQRLGGECQRAEGLLALDGPLARRHATLPPRRAQLVPPAAGAQALALASRAVASECAEGPSPR